MTTTTPTVTDLDAQVANDVARLHQLAEEIKDRSEQADEIKGRLRQLGAGTWRHDGRDVLDIAVPGLQFNVKLAAEIIPAPLQASCSQTVLHGPTAKKVLPADLYERCCTEKAAAVKTL